MLVRIEKTNYSRFPPCSRKHAESHEKIPVMMRKNLERKSYNMTTRPSACRRRLKKF